MNNILGIKKRKKKMEYNRIKQMVLSKGHKFFENGDYNLNFIWERTSDKITNYFTDLLHILYKVNGVETILTIPCTTKPGIKGSIDTPITYGGVTGTAIIIPNQYIGAWQFTYGDKSKSYPFSAPHFKQIKPINYWRDGNKDLVIDEVQEQDNKIYVTHWHIMGEPVNNWSLGCMGFSAANMLDKIVPLVKNVLPIHGDRFTGTIIETY